MFNDGKKFVVVLVVESVVSVELWSIDEKFVSLFLRFLLFDEEAIFVPLFKRPQGDWQNSRLFESNKVTVSFKEPLFFKSCCWMLLK